MKISKEIIITGLVIAVLFGAGGFFAGTKFQQGRRAGFMMQGVQGINNQRTGNGQNVPGGFRGGATSGEIISADEKSITVKLTDGSSKIILLDDKTQINKASEATKDDLKTGEKVLITGTSNSDGSITAQNIQLSPDFINQKPQQ
jgi:hypothetical protein